MEIKLDQKAIEGILTETAANAIKNSLNRWSLQEKLSSFVSENLATNVIAQALEEAAKNIEAGTLAAKLAEEMERAVTKATISLIREGFLSVVCTLRGIGNYGQEDEKKRKQIFREIFGE
jgi:uncharacterized protein YejL (UPF0352 family)